MATLIPVLLLRQTAGVSCFSIGVDSSRIPLCPPAAGTGNQPPGQIFSVGGISAITASPLQDFQNAFHQPDFFFHGMEGLTRIRDLLPDDHRNPPPGLTEGLKNGSISAAAADHLSVI